MRTKLDDCAVEFDQSWWKILDFLELKRSSISFFEIDKHESAISRWSRARIRAAKIGKGLSKNSKAQKLVKRHWLEAIDPQHRYGHNLHFYYEKWLESPSKEPFFYWLDIGEGKEINLVDKCPRSKLQQQCVVYLGPLERMSYEVVVDNDGKLVYKQTKMYVNTTEPKDAKWIFVLSTSMALYVGKKKKGSFQHSSFLSGGAIAAAGRIVVENGILKAVSPYSGHYKPKPENFQDLIVFLKRKNVDLTNVKTEPVMETNNVKVVNLKHEDLTKKSEAEAEKGDGSQPRTLKGLFDLENVQVVKKKKHMVNSYQMGNQLSYYKCSTQAATRIGYLLDYYPRVLQFHTLEQQPNISSRRASVRSKEQVVIKKMNSRRKFCCGYQFSSPLHKFRFGSPLHKFASEFI